MTPSNNPNGQPLIYRIADKLGVFHLVAPVDHQHSQAEVAGLESALAGKANTSDMTTALATKANAVPAGSPTGGIVIANTEGKLSRSNKTVTDLLNAIDGKMDAMTIDTAPTADSTNLVESGGVDAAIKDAINVIFGDSLPYNLSVLDKDRLYTCLLQNKTGNTITLSNCFDASELPESSSEIFYNIAAHDVSFSNMERFGVRIVRKTEGVYIWYDGLFEY